MLLSVIIPVYNEEKTIRKVVEKVRQVRIPKEMVIVDDGSTDATAQIIDDLKEEEKPDKYFSKYVIVHKRNGGKGSALKDGIKIASGDIIVF